MPALSYKSRFAEYVENGLKHRPLCRVKRQTIRNHRKRPFLIGDRLIHYYAQRSKHCKKLGESVARYVNAIEITERGITIYYRHGHHRKIWRKDDRDRFAFDDGFDNWEEMKRWWKLTHGPDCFPFDGVLIRW